ncbi:MAG: hypothetical protein ACTSPB_01515 [Candidatus Thorarchaeota archaeon]
MKRQINYPSKRKPPRKHVVKTKHPRYVIPKYTRGKGFLPSKTVKRIEGGKFIHYDDPNLSQEEKIRRQQSVIRLLMRTVPDRNHGEFNQIVIGEYYDGKRIKSMGVAHPAGVMQLHPNLVDMYFEPTTDTSHISLSNTILHEYGHYDYWFGLDEDSKTEWKRWYNEDYAKQGHKYPLGARLSYGTIIDPKSSYREAYAEAYAFYNSPSKRQREGFKELHPEIYEKFKELSKIKPKPPIKNYDNHLSKMTGQKKYRRFNKKKFELEKANLDKEALKHFKKNWTRYRSRRSVKYRDPKGRERYAIYAEVLTRP